jgi:hypothetical protein
MLEVAAPIAWYFLSVFESDLYGLSILDADLSKIESVLTHCKLWNGEICNEFDGVRRSSLDVNRYNMPLLTKLSSSPRFKDNIEKDGDIWIELLYFVRLNYYSCLVKQFLVKVECNWDLTNIRKAEGFTLGVTSNYITEIADISCN